MAEFTLFPTDEDPLEPNPLLDQIEAGLDDPLLFGDGAADDVSIAVDTAPPPLGRTWRFDFAAQTFVNGSGWTPLIDRGRATLLQWIEKAMLTERGSCPIHPDEYGMEDPFSIIGRRIDAAVPDDLEARVRRCLTYHPRIRDVRDLEWAVDQDDGEAVVVSFTVLLVDEDELQVAGLVLR